MQSSPKHSRDEINLAASTDSLAATKRMVEARQAELGLIEAVSEPSLIRSVGTIALDVT